MKTQEINGIPVAASEELSDAEIKEYVKYKQGLYPVIKSIRIEADGEYVNIWVDTGNRPFKRIRRITGYLVGSLENFNNGKRAEERDRVKHATEGIDAAL